MREELHRLGKDREASPPPAVVFPEEPAELVGRQEPDVAEAVVEVTLEEVPLLHDRRHEREQLVLRRYVVLQQFLLLLRAEPEERREKPVVRERVVVSRTVAVADGAPGLRREVTALRDRQLEAQPVHQVVAEVDRRRPPLSVPHTGPSPYPHSLGATGGG